MNLIGLRNEVIDALSALKLGQPVLFYGPTGNGKTLAAWEVARQYSKDWRVPIIYLQLYPEMTKNTLIGGETIKNGSIVIEEQAILQLGKKGKGAIFIIDECTHTTEPVLLSFNSLVEAPFQTVVGDKIYELDPKTRFVFCGNTPDHTGNIHLPTSFANRVYVVKIGLPDKATLISIGKEAESECPEALLEFVAELITKVHDASFPISGRNMAMAAKSIPDLFGSEEKKIDLPTKISSVCKKHKICGDRLKRVLMSVLMANIVCPSNGPEKVAALLW